MTDVPERRAKTRVGSPDKRLVLAGALLLFAVVFVFRLILPNPTDALAVLYCVPIALLAAVFGTQAGKAAAGLAMALVVVWVVVADVNLDAVAYGTRGTTFLLVGWLVGWLADRNRSVAKVDKQFFALSHDLFGIASFEGRFVRVNAAWERLLGYTEEEMCSRPYSEFVHPDDLAATAAETTSLAGGKDTMHFANRYRAKDGSWHWLEWSARSSLEDGVIYTAAHDITDQRELEEKLRGLADHDSLTSLFNRKRFAEEVEAELVRASRLGSSTAMLMIDVDRFKTINDTYGHQAGDKALTAISAILRSSVRASDIVARFGGDEFAILLPHADVASAELVANKIRNNAASSPLALGKTSVRLTLSTGAAATASSPEQLTPARLLALADGALYESKRSDGYARTAIG
ncbi:MAG: sensor domain-containing diguanylate cyclase [Actinomycetota bacterium]